MSIVDVAPNVQLMQDNGDYAKVKAPNRAAAEQVLSMTDFRAFGGRLVSARWGFDWVERSEGAHLTTWVFARV